MTKMHGGRLHRGATQTIELSKLGGGRLHRGGCLLGKIQYCTAILIPHTFSLGSGLEITYVCKHVMLFPFHRHVNKALWKSYAHVHMHVGVRVCLSVYACVGVLLLILGFGCH